MALTQGFKRKVISATARSLLKLAARTSDSGLVRFIAALQPVLPRIDFYQNGYNIRFCSREMSGIQLQFVRHLREELRPELEQQLGRLPTEEELDQAADEQFPCQHGFLFQVGRAPGDHLWTLFLFGFILLVELAGLAFIIRWLKRMWIALRL